MHGISQARILEWVAISFFEGASQPRDLTQVSCIGGGFITTEPLGKPYNSQEELLKVGPFSHGPCSTRVDNKVEPYILSLGQTQKLRSILLLHNLFFTVEGYFVDLTRYFESPQKLRVSSKVDCGLEG